MYLLSHRKNKHEMEAVYWKQSNLDISSVVSGMYDWYALVVDDEIRAECGVVLNACSYFEIDDVEVIEEARGQGYCQKLLQLVLQDLLLTIGYNGVTIQAKKNTPQDSCYFNAFAKYKNVVFDSDEDYRSCTLVFDSLSS